MSAPAETIGTRVATALISVVVAAIFTFGTMIAVAHFAQPEPGPCRDTFELRMRSSPMCAAPQADGALVVGAGAIAGLVAGGGVIVLRRRSRVPQGH